MLSHSLGDRSQSLYEYVNIYEDYLRENMMPAFPLLYLLIKACNYNICTMYITRIQVTTTIAKNVKMDMNKINYSKGSFLSEKKVRQQNNIKSEECMTRIRVKIF